MRIVTSPQPFPDCSELLYRHSMPGLLFDLRDTFSHTEIHTAPACLYEEVTRPTHMFGHLLAGVLRVPPINRVVDSFVTRKWALRLYQL